MNYLKPAVAVLGNASELIENAIPSKSAPSGEGVLNANPAYDLDE